MTSDDYILRFTPSHSARLPIRSNQKSRLSPEAWRNLLHEFQIRPWTTNRKMDECTLYQINRLTDISNRADRRLATVLLIGRCPFSRFEIY